MDVLKRNPCGIQEWREFREIVAGVDPEFGRALDAKLEETVDDA